MSDSLAERHYHDMVEREGVDPRVAAGDQIRLLAAQLRSRQRGGAPMPMWQARADAAQRLLVLALRERATIEGHLRIIGQALGVDDDDDESID